MVGNVTVQSVNLVTVATSYTLGLESSRIIDYYTKATADTGYTATSVIVYNDPSLGRVLYGVNESVATIAALFDDVTQTEVNLIIAGAGLDTDGSYNTPSGTNWLDATTSLADADAVLDTTIGAAVTPTVRTNNPIVALNDVNTNIEALDGAIGTDAQLASQVFTNVANSVNQNLEGLDYDANQKNLIVGLGGFADGTITAAIGGGEVAIQSRVMGLLGDTLTVRLVDTGGTPGTITWVFPDLVIEIDATVGTGTTDDDIADWINNDAILNKYFYVSTSSSGTMDDMAVAVTLSGSDSNTTFPDDAGSTLISSAAIIGTNRFPTVYNAVQIVADGVDILNQRDVHTMTREHIYKHPLMCVAKYDFAVDGTGSGGFPRTVTLNLDTDGATGIAMIPDNAIIIRGIVDEHVPLTSAGSGGTLKFKLPTDGDLCANITANGGGAALYDVIPVGTAATAIKTTAARTIQVEIGTEAITAGEVTIYLEYYVSE